MFSAAPTPPALALGVVACDDTTFVNGIGVGSMSGCIAFRSYALQPGLLRVGENSVAVRAHSAGGKPNVPYPQASPGERMGG